MVLKVLCLWSSAYCMHIWYIWLCVAKKVISSFPVCDSEPSFLFTHSDDLTPRTDRSGSTSTTLSLSLSLLFNMNQSSFTETSWFALLLSYIWLCSFNCLIMHLFWWNPLNLLHHANLLLFNWLISKSFYHLFIPPNGLELNLMAVLCRCSWWQSRFPADFRPMFRQPVRQPQGVHRLQRSSRGAKPRKSYSLNCLFFSMPSVITLKYW